MRLFLDSCVKKDIEGALETGFVEGLTTNPALLGKAESVSAQLLKDIANLVKGPVSFQVLSESAEEMVLQGKNLAKIASNVVVKIPLTWQGLQATRQLTSKGIPVNVTLCFSSAQALLAAKAGATYISPFIGRLEDAGENGLQLIEDIRILYDFYGLDTQIMAASIRNVGHVVGASKGGADIATLPFKVFSQLAHHTATDKGLADIVPLYGTLQQKLLS